MNDNNQILFLWVDDMIHRFEDYINSLESNNFQVVTAANWETALTLFERYNFPVVVTDIVMPMNKPIDGWDAQSSGFYFLKKLKEVNPSTRVIICSVTGGHESVLKALQLEANDYIFKPFNVSDLAQKVKEQFDKFNAKNATNVVSKQTLKNKIAKSQLREVFDELMAVNDIDVATKNDIITLSSEFENANRNNNLGLTHDSKELNRITVAILNIIDQKL